MSSEGPALIWGWVAVSVSVVCFGTFGVPIKFRRVLDHDVHPLVYQSWKTLFAFLSCWIVLAWSPWQFTWWGLVSAAVWVPSGVATVIVFTLCGLGLGSGIQHSISALTSFLWGLIIFQEAEHNILMSLGGILCLGIGVFGVTFFAKQSSSSPPPPPVSEIELATSSADEMSVDASADLTRPLSRDALAPLPPPLSISTLRQKSWWWGIVLAVCNGISTGSIMVPLTFARRAGAAVHGISYVIPFAVGSLIVNSVLWIAMIAYCLLSKRRIPELQLKVMLVPGSLSGALWAAGHFGSVYATLILGQIGYSVLQGSVIVASLWGLFLYREVVGWKRMAMWFLSLLLCVGGIILLGLSR